MSITLFQGHQADNPKTLAVEKQPKETNRRTDDRSRTASWM